MTNAEKLTLAKHACHIRMGVIEGTHSAKCGHPGGSLDIAELLSYLYFVEMNIDPKDLLLGNLWRVAPKLADKLLRTAGYAIVENKGRISVKPVNTTETPKEEKPAPRCRKRTR